MYTEDDKYTKYKPKNSYSNEIKNNSNIKSLSQSPFDDEDYYKDYYDDYKTYQEPVKVTHKAKTTINKIDTTYNDDIDKNYYYDKGSLSKRKYIVLVIILLIVLSVLVVILMHSINVKTLPTGTTNNYINLFYNELELRVGDKKKLEVNLSETSKNYKIEWFSNNDNVVTVDKNGNIVAVNEGDAIILVAYYVDDKVYDDECRIHVLK